MCIYIYVRVHCKYIPICLFPIRGCLLDTCNLYNWKLPIFLGRMNPGARSCHAPQWASFEHFREQLDKVSGVLVRVGP